jgi:hypothetical protein
MVRAILERMPLTPSSPFRWFLYQLADAARTEEELTRQRGWLDLINAYAEEFDAILGTHLGTVYEGKTGARSRFPLLSVLKPEQMEAARRKADTRVVANKETLDAARNDTSLIARLTALHKKQIEVEAKEGASTSSPTVEEPSREVVELTADDVWAASL